MLAHLDAFNRAFEFGTNAYVKALGKLVNRRFVTFAILGAFAFGVLELSRVVPAGFVPNEDQGQIYAIIQTPPGSTLERTNDVSRELQSVAKSVEGVASVSSLAGYEILTEGRGSNAGTCLINLEPWAKRSRSVNQMQKLTGLVSFFVADYPQFEIEVDNELARQKGVSIKTAMANLNILIGSTYEQGFVRSNTFSKVYTQAAPEFRRFPSVLMNLYVKDDKGEMVPYSAFIKLKQTQGPNEITRFNMYNSAAIRGGPAKGYTSGDAIASVREVAATTSYYELIAIDNLLDVLKRNVEVLRAALEIVKLEKQAARVTELVMAGLPTDLLGVLKWSSLKPESGSGWPS